MRKLISIITALLTLTGTLCFSGCSRTEAPGRVYFLNFKPEADEAWQKLAQEYSEITGVQVKVQTVSSGDYNTQLTAAMSGQWQPSLFQCTGTEELKKWSDYTLDLTGSAVHNACLSDSYNLLDSQGKVRAIGYCYEAYGIIVNKTLLGQAGYEINDLTDFSTLKEIAEDITNRRIELGFSAFTSSGLASGTSWRFSGHLANMPLYYELKDTAGQPAAVTGEYLYAFKNLWDLYMDNATCTPDEIATRTGIHARNEFTQNQAVFYQNGSWEYAGLLEAGMKAEELAMIPLYCGVEGEENAGLCCGTENYWVVNAKSSQADQEATLDFLQWVVTSDSGLNMMNQQFGGIPFKNARATTNVFIQTAIDLHEQGNYTVTWEFSKTPDSEQWRADFVQALQRYTLEGASWSEVESAFVDGWANCYARQNPQ